MPRSSLTSVHIDVSEEPEELPRIEPDTPFRILVAGNFSGGAGRFRKPVPVDRDNFEEVLALLSPQLNLQLAGSALPLKFRDLDDFHPDQLFHRLAPFQALRDLRERLADRATFKAAAAQLEPPPDVVSAPPAANLSGADLLRDMMGEEPAPPQAAPARSDWDQMLHELVAPYSEPKPDRRQTEWVAQTDAAITGEMRVILHHPEFQELEAAWRGLFFLVRRLETSDSLKVSLLDMPLEELTSPDGLATLRRVAVDEAIGTPGAEPWAAIAGLYYFGPQQEEALVQIGAIAARAGAPFLAGVGPEVVGLTKVFGGLRSAVEARWVGLIMPRFLLRLPYGRKTDSTERFDFEEMPSPPEHHRYLWCNPAVAGAYLLGEAFTRSGWDMRPGEVSMIEGLPAHVFTGDGESQLKPCAEVLLTEEAADLLLERGLMPLASYKGRDCVKLVKFQSVAEPPKALAGRWE